MSVTFVSRAEWGARRPKSVSYDIQPARGGVSLHYGGPAQHIGGHEECAAKVRGWQNYHMDGRGWADLAYTMVVCPHGYVFAGRGAGVRTAANGTVAGNDFWYAVCSLLGDGEEPTPEMLEAYLWAIEQLRAHGGAAGQVNGHRDHKSTACPGDPVYGWIAAGMPGGGTTTPPPTTWAPPFPLRAGYYFGPRDGGVKSISGYYSATHREALSRWQQRMIDRGWGRGFAPYGADGYYGDRTRDVARAFQAEKGLSVDGLIGPRTWAAAWTAPVT